MKEEFQNLKNKFENSNKYIITLDYEDIKKLIEISENLISRNKELEYKLREHICIQAHEQVKQLYIPKSKVREKIDFIKSLNEKIYYEENVISILKDLLKGDK